MPPLRFSRTGDSAATDSNLLSKIHGRFQSQHAWRICLGLITHVGFNAFISHISVLHCFTFNVGNACTANLWGKKPLLFGSRVYFWQQSRPVRSGRLWKIRHPLFKFNTKPTKFKLSSIKYHLYSMARAATRVLSCAWQGRMGQFAHRNGPFPKIQPSEPQTSEPKRRPRLFSASRWWNWKLPSHEKSSRWMETDLLFIAQIL